MTDFKGVYRTVVGKEPPIYDDIHLLRLMYYYNTGNWLPIFSYGKTLRLVIENLTSTSIPTDVPTVVLKQWAIESVGSVGKLVNDIALQKIINENYTVSVGDELLTRPGLSGATIYNWSDASIQSTLLNGNPDPDEIPEDGDPITLAYNYDETLSDCYWFRSTAQTSFQPVYESDGINGKGCISPPDATGTLSPWDPQDVANGLDITLWCVFQASEIIDSETLIYGISSGTSDRRCYAIGASAAGNWTMGYGDSYPIDTGVGVDTNAHIFIMRSNSGAGAGYYQMWIDGGSPASAGQESGGWNGTLNDSGQFLGNVSSYTVPALSLMGEWGMSDELTIAQIDDLTQWLGQQWGISVSTVTE